MLLIKLLVKLISGERENEAAGCKVWAGKKRNDDWERGAVHMKMFLLHFSTLKGTTKWGKRPTFWRKSEKTKDWPFLPKAEVFWGIWVTERNLLSSGCVPHKPNTFLVVEIFLWWDVKVGLSGGRPMCGLGEFKGLGSDNLWGWLESCS